MLRWIQISRPSMRQSLLKDFDPKSAIWVVSDLRTKTEILSQLIAKQGYAEEASVLRVSELWQQLIRKYYPRFRLISLDLATTELQSKLEGTPQEGLEQIILDLAGRLFPILLDEDGVEKLEDWLKSNSGTQKKWGYLLPVVKEFVFSCLQQNKIYMPWVPHFLVQELSGNADWIQFFDKKWIFDLGGDLKVSESEVIREIARVTDVDVVSPVLSKKLPAYDLLQGYAGEHSELDENPSLKKQTHYLRMTSPLDETKFVTAKIRALIESGVAAHEISVISQEPETYWALMHPYFSVEGIAASKDLVTKVHSIPAIQQWLGRLRLRVGQIDTANLAAEVFSESDEKPVLRYEDFHALTKEVLDSQDLTLVKELEKGFLTSVKNEKITANQFLGWSLKSIATSVPVEVLEKIMKEFVKQTFGLSLQLHSRNWVHFLEQVCARAEVKIQPGHRQGVWVLGTPAAEVSGVKHRFFVGLNETQYQSSKITLIQASEVARIGNDLGYFLESEEDFSALVELEWLIKDESLNDFYLAPAASLDGTPATPLPFWLANFDEGEGRSQKLETRWDEIQKVKMEELFSGSALKLQRLKQDLGEEIPTESIAHSLSRFSPSNIESFMACPAAFLHEKIFGLIDPPVVDLDVDRRTHGRLVHSLLETIAQDLNRDWSRTDIEKILEDIRVKMNIPIKLEILWLGLKQKYALVAERFIEFERSWRSQYPHFKPAYFEKKLYFNLQRDGKTTEFTGIIDRIDVDLENKKAVILDYKLSAFDLNNYNKWIEEGEIQLLFYVWAIENAHVPELQDVEVIGAFYYILKNFERERGFRMAEGENTAYPSSRRKNLLTAENKKELLANFETELFATIDKIKAGQFPAQPRDEKNCVKCQWRTSCRAPHLI